MNAAFVINQEIRDRLVEEDPGSAEILKPFLEGKDLKKWHAQPRGLWLITMPKFWTRQMMGKGSDDTLNEDVAWMWLQKQYGSVANWLEPFAEKGRKRGDKGEFWWELRACAYYEKFKKRSILDICEHFSFFCDAEIERKDNFAR